MERGILGEVWDDTERRDACYLGSRSYSKVQCLDMRQVDLHTAEIASSAECRTAQGRQSRRVNLHNDRPVLSVGTVVPSTNQLLFIRQLRSQLLECEGGETQKERHVDNERDKQQVNCWMNGGMDE